jgi:hypothetical protein
MRKEGKMSNPTIKGKTLTTIYTLNTMYADGCVELNDKDGNVYRIKVDEFLGLIKDVEFDVEMKRKYNYLTVKPKTK